MRHLFSTTALAALIALLSACGSDNDEPQQTKMFTLNDAVTKTVSGTTGLPFDVNTDLTFDINYTTRTVDVKTLGVRFSQHQPYGIDLDFDGCKVTNVDGERFSFTGTGFNPMEGYTVNNVSGTFDISLNTGCMKYSVVTSKSTSQIYAFSKMLYSTLPNNATNYYKTAECFYKFLYSVGDNGGVEANVYIDNISFAEGMPKLSEMRIPLGGATVTSTPNGYTAQGTDIVPFNLQGQTEVPMNSRTINNLILQVNVASKTFHIEFDCFGLHYTDDGALYL